VVGEVKLAVEIAAVTHFGSTVGAETYAVLFSLLNDVEIFDVGVVRVVIRLVCHRLSSFLKMCGCAFRRCFLLLGFEPLIVVMLRYSSVSAECLIVNFPL
jgi:hypothetical protein